jgi:hypothetical protein
MQSKERVLATIRRQPVDHVPLCVEGICHGYVRFINERYPDPEERARFYLGLGMDTGIMLYPPSFSFADVKVRAWRETPPGEPYPLLFKEYVTPDGTLRQVVRKTPDYPDSIELVCDHNVPPSRSRHYLVEGEQHLAALEHILRLPEGREMDDFLQTARTLRRFCRKAGIVFSACAWGVGDPMVWFSGVEPLLMMAMTQPEVLARYVDIVSRWNRRLVELCLDIGVDLVVRRGWYESTDFWSPTLYERFLLPSLAGDVALAHQAAAVVTYVMASGSMPLLPYFRRAGVDIYSNIDPHARGTDMRAIKSAIGDAVTLCGGINNYHVLERGEPEDVERAVREAFEALSPGGGCILAPADVPNSLDEPCPRNFRLMVDAWKRLAW